MDDYKKRVQQALENFHSKQIKKDKGPTRRNQHPERDLTQKPCVTWMRSQGFSVDIIEAKATFDPRKQIYRQQSVKAGFVDCVGTDPNGYAVYIEFKAPGRISTLRENQRQFLLTKISHGAFAVVTDDLNDLISAHAKWSKLKAESRHAEAIEFLEKRMKPRPQAKIFF